MNFIWCQKFPVLPCTFEVTYPKARCTFASACGRFSEETSEPSSFSPASSPCIGKHRLWGSASHPLLLMPAKILFWPKPGSGEALRASPACIPDASAFLVTFLIQGISAFSKIQLTLQHSVLVAGQACFTPHPLPCLFCEDLSSSSCSSKSNSSLITFPLQKASQTFSTWITTHHCLPFRR